MRKQMLEKRNSLNPDFVAEAARCVFEKITSTNILNFKQVLVYSSFKNEMPTNRIIEYLLSKGRRVFLPRCDTGKLTFEAVEIFSGHNEYEINKYGIMEPKPLFEGKSFEIDCAIVPGIIFDKSCNRIGFGKGYYDKFLYSNPGIYKVGLCYEFQVSDRIETSPHDVPMDTVITERSIYSRK